MFSLQVVIVVRLNTAATAIVAVVEIKLVAVVEIKLVAVVEINLTTNIDPISTAVVPVPANTNMATVVAAAAVISIGNYRRKDCDFVGDCVTENRI